MANASRSPKNSARTGGVKRTGSRTLRNFQLGVVVFAVAAIGSYFVWNSFALSPGAAPDVAPSGSCAVTPDPVAAGSSYSLMGSELGAGQAMTVLVTDSAGTHSWNATADTDGIVTVTGHAAQAGPASVKIEKAGGHTAVAICSFNVS